MLCNSIFHGSDGTRVIRLPVSLWRIINNAIQIFHINRRKPSDLEPAHIVEAVRSLFQRLVIVHGDDSFSQKAQENASLLFCMLLYSTLASRCVLEEHHLTWEAFEWVIGE